MGGIQDFYELQKLRNCIVIFINNKIICNCGIICPDIEFLVQHLKKHPIRKEPEDNNEDALENLFLKEFRFNGPNEEGNITVNLPKNLVCVCLNEHDIGAFSKNLLCHICLFNCDDLQSLNKHIANVHKVSQVLVGENILFDRPEFPKVKGSDYAYYCPMPKCKYHIVESDQTKYFKTFKLLKQHYVKVHATKSFVCEDCSLKFGSPLYLESHKKTCGKSFTCACGSSFSSLEGLQTHCRRKSHILDPIYTPRLSQAQDSILCDKLAILKSRSSNDPPIPIAPKPSAMHVNAAIALSELGIQGNQFTSKADIGIQIEMGELFKSRKSSPPEGLYLSPKKLLSFETDRVNTETQTKANGKRKLAASTVSSQVQTTGEFTVRPKRSRIEPRLDLANQGSQCKMSPMKTFLEDDRKTVTTNTITMGCESVANFSLSVDIPDFEYLWPLRINTNGTQTSPRVNFERKLSIDSVDSLPIPELEKIVDISSENMSKFPLSEVRQFSTETQTELDTFLNSSDWSRDIVLGEMETQTYEEENLMLCANNCTQTWPEDRDFQQLLCQNVAETQTSLTGFHGHNISLGGGEMSTDTELSHIETQTVDFQDLLNL